MKKLFTMLMVAAAATGTVFTSCSKDDDQAPEPAKEPKYVVANDTKSWTFTQVKQGADGEYSPATGGGITFKADGTFEATHSMFSTFEPGTKYSYDGEDTITIKGKDQEMNGKEVTVTITIVKLTADEFEIQVKVKGRGSMGADDEENVSFKGSFR